MEDVIVQLDEHGRGRFYISNGTKELGEMVVAISAGNLTVYHTEVAPEAEGRGLAKKMLLSMTAYARANQLNVIPLCPYVHAQFKRHPEDYADLWNR